MFQYVAMRLYREHLPSPPTILSNMNSDIFILLYIILGLSAVFFVSSMAVLRLRRRHGFHFHPLAYAALLLAAMIPVTSGSVLADLKLHYNALGDVRVEVYAHSDEDVSGEIIGEIRIPSAVYQTASAAALTVSAVWLVGMAAKLSYNIANYFDSVRVLIKRSRVCHRGELYEIFSRARQKTGLRRNVVLRVTELNISPCTCGFLSPIVFVGSAVAGEYPPEKLELIFIHELTHIRHCDIVTKFIALIAGSFHWFSPVGKYIGQAVFEDCEYRCDAGVLSVVGDCRRFEYISTILDIAERNLAGIAEPGAQYGRNFSEREISFRSTELLNRADGTSSGGGQSNSHSGKFLLKRYENMKKRRAVSNHVLYIFPLMVISAAVNMFLMSSVSVTNRDDPGIDFLNPYFSAVMCEYYGLSDPDEIAESHVNGIYSMEFGISDRFEQYRAVRNDYEEKAALYCVVNEGRLYTAGGLVDGVNLNTVKQNGYRCAVDVLPDVIRADAMKYYLPGDGRDLTVLRLYQRIDAGEAVVEVFTEKMYGALLTEYGLDVHADREEILCAIEQYCAKVGLEYRGNGSVGEALAEIGQAMMSELSPAAVYMPMELLKFDADEEEINRAIEVCCQAGLLKDKLISSPNLDMRDISLFGGLRTLIFKDGLYTEQPGVYDNLVYAVIGEKPENNGLFPPLSE